MDGTVLVADDDRTIRMVLTQALTRAGCKVHATSSLTTLMRWVAEGKGDVVISDVMMPDGNGLEVLPKIAQDRPGLPVIVISAQNTIMTAIKAAEAEAFDYLPKPFDLPDLMKRTARALAQRSRSPVPAARYRPGPPEELPLVGRTPAMQALYRAVAQLLNVDLPVLITGESGTGKSLIARAFHQFSDRRDRPLVLADDEDLSQTDAVQRLLARVGDGTLLIENLGDLGDRAQARLLRIIEVSGQGGPRFIATAQGDPVQAVTAGRLRGDLYYRVGGAVMHVPPLRDRLDDIALLATHFLTRAAAGTLARSLSPQARDMLRTHPWPGNVRELENALRLLSLGTPGEAIGAAELGAILGARTQASPPPVQSGTAEVLADSVARHLQRYFDLHGAMLPPPGLYPRILREVETPLIEIALAATGGNQAKCADLLGINRNTLRKKITDLDIEVTRRRKMM